MKVHSSNADYVAEVIQITVLENTLSQIKFSERMSALQNNKKTRKRILPFVTEYRSSVQA